MGLKNARLQQIPMGIGVSVVCLWRIPSGVEDLSQAPAVDGKRANEPVGRALHKDWGDVVAPSTEKYLRLSIQLSKNNQMTLLRSLERTEWESVGGSPKTDSHDDQVDRLEFSIPYLILYLISSFYYVFL